MLAYIYQIRNTVNQKIYIGSTRQKKPRARWDTGHVNFLRKGTHNNAKLQHSWNKHGEKAFVFEVLEIFEWKEHVEIEIKEQEYIDRLDPFYNIMKKVVRNEGLIPYTVKRQSKHYILTKPCGEEIAVENLKKFCRENDLSPSCMYGVEKGLHSHHQGWLCRRAGMSKEEFEKIQRKKKPFKSKHNPEGLQYEVVSPTGEIFLCDRLKEFCREHNLGHSAMRSVLKGDCRHNKGWRVRYQGREFAHVKEPNVGRLDCDGNPVKWFVRDVGTQEVVTSLNISHFCRERGLTKEGNTQHLYKKGEGQKFTYSRYEDFRDVPYVPNVPSKARKPIQDTSLDIQLAH